MRFLHGLANFAYVHASKLTEIKDFTIQVLHPKSSKSLQLTSKVSIHLYNLKLNLSPLTPSVSHAYNPSNFDIEMKNT